MKPISDINIPYDMSAFWMPFTANQQFKAAPGILKSGEGMCYHSEQRRSPNRFPTLISPPLSRRPPAAV